VLFRPPQDCPWTDVCALGNSTHEEIQYRNAVWDMFQLETKYLAKLLQPLELVGLIILYCVISGQIDHLFACTM